MTVPDLVGWAKFPQCQLPIYRYSSESIVHDCLIQGGGTSPSSINVGNEHVTACTFFVVWSAGGYFGDVIGVEFQLLCF